MKIYTIKTGKVTPSDEIFDILDKYLKSFEEKSVLVVASKIISICEGSIINEDKINKDELVEKESEYYLPREKSKYGYSLTIKNNVIIPEAGIDQSNAGGKFYVLWPKNSQETANKIREYLCKRFQIRYAGVVITDSKTTPLRWGTTGVAISHSGFEALKDYIGKPDVFGRRMHATKMNIMDALAAAAVVMMGEGKEQTPLAIIEDLPFVKFQPRNPTKRELEDLRIELEDDLYAPFLKAAPWKKGGQER